MGKFFNITLILCLTAAMILGQTKKNVEKVYELIEKSVTELTSGKVQKENKIFIDFDSPEGFSILKNSLIEKTGAVAKIAPKKEEAEYILAYTVEDAAVKYSETFTKSFLGASFVEREVSLKGFGGLNKQNESVSTGHFSHSIKDTVAYKELKELGNQAYPFSNPEIPPEPFFASIWEPLIVVAVAVTTVYLLFTVRSK